MASAESATNQLIRLLHDTTYDDLPPHVIEETKRLILDTIGCALGARNLEAARIAIETSAALGGPNGAAPASIMGTEHCVSPAAATSANMYLGNLLDADDTWLKVYLYSRAQSVMGGTAQIQKNIIATRILGLPTS